MPKSDFVEPRDAAFSAQLTLFKNTIGPYGTSLGLSAGDIAGQAADADYFAYVLACQEIYGNAAQQWTAWKDQIRSGKIPLATVPSAPTLPTSVPSTSAGIETRFRALAKKCKTSSAYDRSIGEALGIEGPEHSGPDLTTIAPVITATLKGNQVLVGWGWAGNSAFLDLCELQVDRGSGWTLLAFDSTPNYTDTTALPATPTKWKYRAIYRVGDAQVGVWSNTVEITVGG